ncbi:MAG: hypothetical protein AB7G87_01305 [Clostridia bacterium]
MLKTFIKKKCGEGILTGLLWFAAVAVGTSVLAVGIWTHIGGASTSASTNIESSTLNEINALKALAP